MNDEVLIEENNLTVDEYRLLRVDAGWKEINDEQIAQSIDACDYIVTARHGTQIVGMARCLTDGVYMAYVFDVIVHSEYRGKGIGRKMVEKVINHFETDNDYLMQIVLLAITADVEPFYRKMGFKKYPNILNGSGMGMWIHGKPY